MSKIQCPKCKKDIEIKKSTKGIYYFFCDNCKIGGKGDTETEAKNNFIAMFDKQNNSLAIFTAPKSPSEVPKWVEANIAVILQQSCQFIDKPATQMLINKNAKYIMTANFKDTWKTAEGQMSIVYAFLEAMYMGASLPDMGSIVPFGNIVEFIPAITAFEFALTSGKNPPFKNISIDCIYENDKYEIQRTNGNFNFKLNMAIPRGEVIGVVVQAFDIIRQATIGEVYDANRLLDKAKEHSRSYRYYLADIQALREAQAEGKEFIIKFEKKYYEKDIKNPYEGADRPEMLKKVAGKSFFRPYMKVRNARAMAEEWDDVNIEEKSFEETIMQTLDASLASFDIKDADFSIDDMDDKKNASDKKENDKTLFQE